ncbi:MAG: zinc-binding dehydrogenase [Polyangiaceae bacterium]|nr:zinc-binding dehydrogenase [Polyangiaceae bacterium]
MRAVMLRRTGGPDALDLVRTGEIAPVIDRTLPLEGAAEAHRLLADRAAVGRIVLVP